MPTVDRTWTFTSDTEGLADVGDSAITFGFDAGSVHFAGAASGTQERGRRSTTGQTWETLGVPAGATVASIQIISWQSRKWAAPASQTPTISMRVVDSAGASIHSAGDLVSVNLGTGTDTGWVNQGAGTSRNVDSGKQASTTDVRLEIELDVSLASSTWDVGVDTILLRITYSGGAPVLVNAGTGATDAGGAWSYTCQAAGAAGRIFIVQIFQDGPNSALTSIVGTNIENLAGTDNVWTEIRRNEVVGTAGLMHLYIGRSTGTNAPTISGANSTSEDLYIRSYQFDGVNTGTTLEEVLENVDAGATAIAGADSSTVADVGVTTLGANRLALNFVYINDDTTTTAFTGETGGDWTEAATYGSASGTDGQIQLQTATIASAGTINGGTYTIAAGLSWGVIGFALKPAVTGPTTYYGATTLAVTVAIAIAGVKKTFGAFALATTATIAAAGSRVAFGAFELPVTVSIAVQGVRGVSGAFSLPVTASLSVSGTRKTFGAISLPITATTSVAGSRKTFGAFDLSTTVSITTDGHKFTNHFGAFSLPLTASISVAGNRTVYGAISLPTTAGISVAGSKTTFSSISLPTTVDIFTKGLLGAFGAFSLPTTVSIDINGTVAGRVYGAFSLETSAAISVVGKVTAFSEIALPMTVGISVAGLRETFGAFSLQEAVSIYVDGQVEGKIYGAFSLETVAAISTVGRLGAKSSMTLPLTVSISTAGARGVQGALSLAAFVDIATAGRVVKFGRISLPVAVDIDTVGFLTAMGAFDLSTVITIVTNGIRRGQEFSVLAATISRDQKSALIAREDPLQGSSLESSRPSATIGP